MFYFIQITTGTAILLKMFQRLTKFFAKIEPVLHNVSCNAEKTLMLTGIEIFFKTEVFI